MLLRGCNPHGCLHVGVKQGGVKEVCKRRAVRIGRLQRTVAVAPHLAEARQGGRRGACCSARRCRRRRRRRCRRCRRRCRRRCQRQRAVCAGGRRGGRGRHWRRGGRGGGRWRHELPQQLRGGREGGVATRRAVGVVRHAWVRPHGALQRRDADGARGTQPAGGARASARRAVAMRAAAIQRHGGIDAKVGQRGSQRGAGGAHHAVAGWDGNGAVWPRPAVVTHHIPRCCCRQRTWLAGIRHRQRDVHGQAASRRGGQRRAVTRKQRHHGANANCRRHARHIQHRHVGWQGVGGCRWRRLLAHLQQRGRQHVVGARVRRHARQCLQRAQRAGQQLRIVNTTAPTGHRWCSPTPRPLAVVDKPWCGGGANTGRWRGRRRGIDGRRGRRLCGRGGRGGQ